MDAYQVVNDSVQTSFNTSFSIYKVSKNGYKNRIKIVNGNENNLFFGIFDEEDVDFEICCDNKNGGRGVCFSLSLDDKHRYIVKAGKTCILETVESIAKKFHMKSQSTDDGKQLVALSADKHGITYNEASVLVSRITFKTEIEKLEISKLLSTTELVGDVIEVNVKTLTGKTVAIKIGSKNTIKDLKLIYHLKEGVPSDQQRFIFKGEQLDDHKMVSDYSIGMASLLHLVLRLRGGGGSLDDLIRHLNEYNIEDNQTNDNPNVGERGVVCFGQKSKQKFKTSYFNADKSIELKPFTIELRMNSIYTPI